MGEISNFHLMSLQRLRRGTYCCLVPSQLQVRIVILEVAPILDAAEIAVVIIIQYGGDLCGSKVRGVRVPIPHLSPSPLGKGSEETRAL